MVIRLGGKLSLPVELISIKGRGRGQIAKQCMYFHWSDVGGEEGTTQVR